jgi:hypothetical protein
MRISLSLLLTPLILASSMVLGADDDTSATAFMKCARIASDPQRLSCYDRLATELIELGVSSAGEATSGMTAGSGPPPAAAPSIPPEADKTTPPAAAANAETMKDPEGGDVRFIVSRYVGEFTGWDGKTIFTLENGQVWQQIQSGRLSWKATNPEITIKRGYLGGYRLSVEGVNKTVRVKRIK